MELEGVFKIKNLTSVDNQFTCQIDLNFSHSLFDGHFRNYPIVPGVVELYILKKIIMSAVKNENISLESIDKVKFVNPIFENELSFAVNVQIENASNNNNLKIKASFTSLNNKMFMSFNGLYKLY